jgi:plasmid stabilization system protein ParE
MARQVIWTPRALADLDHLLTYLYQEWGERVMLAFLDEIDEVIICIEQFPFVFRASGHLDIREAVVTRHNILFYRVTPNAIYLLSIWDTRQAVEKRPYPPA